MQQFDLNLASNITYKPQGFVMHSGVSKTFESCQAIINNPNYFLINIIAKPRYGKTHLAIKLCDHFLKLGLLPQLLDGQNLAPWLIKVSELSLTPNDLIIIDDAHTYLSQINPGDSGPFVTFVETLKRSGAKLIMFFNPEFYQLPCDEHVTSRLKFGLDLGIEVAAESELEVMIRVMARQRGVKLSDLQILHIARRIKRDLPAIEKYLEKLIRLSQVFGKSIKIPLINDAISTDLL